jgi:hypothetical protein
MLGHYGGVTGSVNMKAQTKRDYESVYKNTDFYKNIQHDNARIDYLKKVMWREPTAEQNAIVK